MKLLYLDYNPGDQLHMLRLSRGHATCEIELAMDFDQAYKIIQEHKFDMVLSVPDFPGASISALKQLAKNTPLYFIINTTDTSLSSEMIDPSLYKLYKPISPAIFQKLINEKTDTIAELKSDSPNEFAYIEKLTKGRVALKLDLMQIFLDVVGEECDNVKNALLSRDWQQICGSLHKMKSNLRMFGWTTVVDRLDQAEHQAREQVELSKCADSIPGLLELLQKRLGRVDAEMRKLSLLGM